MQGLNSKTLPLNLLRQKGHEVIDLGPFDKERVDYPDYAVKVCENVLADTCVSRDFDLRFRYWYDYGSQSFSRYPCRIVP